MKKVWLGLVIGLALGLGVAQVALAAAPGPIASKDCIGYCVSLDKVNGGEAVSVFARSHNPAGNPGDACKATNQMIRDLPPPQP